MSQSSQEMALLVASVEHGGFSGAASLMDRTPSAVSKAISRLETRLGVRLLSRTTRRLALTLEGELYYARAKQVLSEIEEIEATITQGVTQPRGLLRVNVGVAFGMHQLVPVLPEFRARFPELELSLDVTDRIVDLMQDQVDVAIRTGDMQDSSFVVRKISDMVRTICAAPAYLRRRGTPLLPQDLAGHDCLLISDMPHLARWPFRQSLSDPQSTSQKGSSLSQESSQNTKQLQLIQVRGSVSATSADALLQMALDGIGIIRLGDIIAGPAIRSGHLVPLLMDWHLTQAVPIHAVLPPGKLRSAKTRVFVDFLVEKFAQAPWRTG